VPELPEDAYQLPTLSRRGQTTYWVSPGEGMVYQAPRTADGTHGRQPAEALLPELQAAAAGAERAFREGRATPADRDALDELGDVLLVVLGAEQDAVAADQELRRRIDTTQGDERLLWERLRARHLMRCWGPGSSGVAAASHALGLPPSEVARVIARYSVVESMFHGLGGAGVEPPPAGVELPALDGRDPLGLLAAVGALVVLTRAAERAHTGPGGCELPALAWPHCGRVRGGTSATGATASPSPSPPAWWTDCPGPSSRLATCGPPNGGATQTTPTTRG